MHASLTLRLTVRGAVTGKVRDEKNRTVTFLDAPLEPGATSRTLILSNGWVLVLDFDTHGHVEAALATPRFNLTGRGNVAVTPPSDVPADTR